MKPTNTKVSRRNFVRMGSLTGAALTIGFYFPAIGKKGVAEILVGNNAAELGIELSAWISIDKTGLVTLYDHRCEMGQGTFQAVPQMIAEELEVNLNDVHIAFAPGAQGKYGSQVTGGSSTIRGSYQQLLLTSATAREMLIAAAAANWKASASDCFAQNGMVMHWPSGKKLSYGELVEAASKIKPPANVALKLRKDYKLIGKPLPRADNLDKIKGTAVFGLDKDVPGMLYAMVERNPRFLGKVKSFDDTAAKAVPGVKSIFKVQMPVFSFTREGVAILATSTWAAMQARKLLKIEWDDSGFVHDSTDTLFKRMTDDLKTPGNSSGKAGDVEKALTQSEKTIEAIYQTPYQSHSCMEPINCVVHWQQDKVEVWGPIQGPDWVQLDLAERLKMKPEQITVNMTFLGGGFGRKAFIDYTAEAAFISKEAQAPVKVIWTREDDMTQGPFRPGAIYQMRGGINGGTINAFAFKMAAQNMDLQNAPKFNKAAANESNTEGFCEPYITAIKHNSFSDVPTEAVIPVMWWRSVYASTNGFAYESFIDELAIAAAKDPIEFRKNHLDNKRHQAVLNKLEELTNWKQREKNAGWGVAITQCFGSIVGEVVKVAKAPDGGVQIEKVYAVIDCGWYVNPDIIKAQMEGSIFMALGAATTHETHFEDGKAVEKNFNEYNMPRIGDISSIHMHIMENEEKPGGVGEPALPPFAPALCNAIFDLTGKRIRKLPFSLQEL